MVTTDFYGIPISLLLYFFQVRVAIEGLPNRVPRNVLPTIDPCVARIIKRTKTAAVLPRQSARCPRKTGAPFNCSIMDHAVRRSRRNLAPDGRTARSWTNPCVGRTGKLTRTYVVFGSPCVTQGETSISHWSWNTERRARNEGIGRKEEKERKIAKGRRMGKGSLVPKEIRIGGIRGNNAASSQPQCSVRICQWKKCLKIKFSFG